MAWVSAGSPRSDFASRGPSSQLLSGQTTGNICCPESSGSCHRLKWHLHSPKSFCWLFIPSKGVCSLTSMDLQIQGTHIEAKKKKSPLKREMLTLEGKQRGKGQATPFSMWVGNAPWHHRLPTPPLQKVPWGLSDASERQSLPSCLLFYGDN